MRVDFYQLGAAPVDGVIAAIATRLLDEGQRLLVIAADDGLLARLDRQLWDQGEAGFLPHGLAGEGDDAAQPILLSTGTDAPNRARNILLADGQWREAALGYDRAFYLFGSATVDEARSAWKQLADRQGIERNYWALDNGKWTRKG